MQTQPVNFSGGIIVSQKTLKKFCSESHEHQWDYDATRETAKLYISNEQKVGLFVRKFGTEGWALISHERLMKALKKEDNVIIDEKMKLKDFKKQFQNSDGKFDILG